MLNLRWMVGGFIVAALFIGGTTLTACFGSSDADEPEEAALDAPAEDTPPNVTPTVPPTVETTSASNAAQSSPAKSTAVHKPPPSADETALTVWVDAALATILQELAASFELEYGLKIAIVETESLPSADELSAPELPEDSPDIFVDFYTDVAQMVANGWLHELTLGDRIAEIAPNALDAFRVEGKLYGLPYSAEVVALIYNPNVVAHVPATWSELQEVSSDLQANGATEYGLVMQRDDPAQFYPILTAFGGFLFGADAQGNVDVENVGLDGTGALAAGAWLDAMNQAGLLLAVADADAMYAAFESGTAAMMIGDAAMLERLRAGNIAYAVAALPGEVEESRALLSARGFLISANSRDPELAQIFLTEFVAAPEIMQAIFAADRRPSAYLPALDAVQDNELSAFIPTDEYAQIAPIIPSLSQVWAIWATALEQVIDQGEPAEAAFAQAAEQIRAVVTKP